MPVLLIAGLVVLGLGIILFLVWIASFIIILKAFLPPVLIIGGGVAAYLGWEEMRDNKGVPLDFSSMDEANRYQAEATAYQAEINDLQDGSIVAEAVVIMTKTASESEEPDPAEATSEKSESTNEEPDPAEATSEKPESTNEETDKGTHKKDD